MILGEISRQMAQARVPYRVALKEFRVSFFRAALEHNNWNQVKTARQLGMHRNTLSRHTAKLGILRPARKKPVRQAEVERLYRRWGRAS